MVRKNLKLGINQAFNIFYKLVSEEMRPDAGFIGPIVKSNLANALQARYTNAESNEPDINGEWQLFFLELNDTLAIVEEKYLIDPNENDKDGTSSIDLIKKQINDRWSSENENHKSEIAWACYFWSHVAPDQGLLAHAVSIDIELLGQPFENVFGEAVPSETEAALKLQNAFWTARQKNKAVRHKDTNETFANESIKALYRLVERIEKHESALQLALDTRSAHINYAAEFLRYAIAKHLGHLTMHGVASEIGVSPAQLSRWYRGKCPSTHSLGEIAEALFKNSQADMNNENERDFVISYKFLHRYKNNDVIIEADLPTMARQFLVAKKHLSFGDF